jgi:putative hydrolase of the HAD superfamily
MMNHAAVRNVIFDVGGVLLEWNPEQIVSGFCADPALRTLLKRAVFEHDDWHELDKGTLKEEQAIQNFGQRTGQSLSDVEALLRMAKESLVPIQPTLDLLDELAAHGVPLYCLSNMAASTFAYLRERYDFWNRFQGIVISAHIRMRKPEPEIFRHLLARFGLAAEACVFIDDLPVNVVSARQVGLQAILFQGAKDCGNQLKPLLGI